MRVERRKSRRKTDCGLEKGLATLWSRKKITKAHGKYQMKVTKTRFYWVLLTGLCFIGAADLIARDAPPGAMENQRDAEAAIALVKRNYVGYRDKCNLLGTSNIKRAETHARTAAVTARTSEDCARIVLEYLRVFDDAHLQFAFSDPSGKLNFRNSSPRVQALMAAAAALTNYEPTARVLSPAAFLISIPSFGLDSKSKIETLLQRYDSDIRSRRFLVIDLRGNGGGYDAAYDSLLPYLYTQPVVERGTDVLATRQNADAWEKLIAPIPDGLSAGAKQILGMYQIPENEQKLRTEVAGTVKMMRAAPEGRFVPKEPDTTNIFPEVFPTPSRVGIIIDGLCASSTEEFLLVARQSKKVTIFGRPSFGVLDYANVRLFILPSQQMLLFLPTTRSRRLPSGAIDNVGVVPDVRFDDDLASRKVSDAAVEYVRHYLERDLPTVNGSVPNGS